MDDDRIIKQRISGKSVRAITARCTTVSEVNEAIDRWGSLGLATLVGLSTSAIAGDNAWGA